MNIFSEEIERLSTYVEEGARATSGNVENFIEPANGTLRRALSKRHHLVFGRRGSGKSSLLYKTYQTLTDSNHATAYIDLEPFKGHLYPDVVLSVLISTLKKIQIWLSENKLDFEGPRLWYTLWILKKNGGKITPIIKSIDKEIRELIAQLNLTDSASLENIVKSGNERTKNESIAGKAKGKIKGIFSSAQSELEAKIANEVKSRSSNEITEKYVRDKQQFLLKRVITYQEIFSKIHNLTNKDIYLIFDDLYHLKKENQPQIIDYFHRLAKGNSIWLKIGTIRHRSKWYIHTPQPIGIKIGDDSEEINLDVTLSKFATTKKFLRSVLGKYISKANSPLTDELLTEGAIDRLVLASGGVARDFLGIFRRSLDEAKERLSHKLDHHRGSRISAEDVNKASGSYGETKQEEFQRDTLEESAPLEMEFKRIKDFVSQTKRNVFLIDQELASSQVDQINELIDLRLIHEIRNRITVTSKPGKVYRAYILDVSQYTGERARKDVEIMEFWKDANKDRIRIASLIYEP